MPEPESLQTPCPYCGETRPRRDDPTSAARAAYYETLDRLLNRDDPYPYLDAEEAACKAALVSLQRSLLELLPQPYYDKLVSLQRSLLELSQPYYDKLAHCAALRPARPLAVLPDGKVIVG